MALGQELHVIDSIWNVSVLDASAGSLIQVNMNYKIYHDRAREVKNEMTTVVWYIHVFPREKDGADSLRVVILKSIIKLIFNNVGHQSPIKKKQTV